MNRHVSYKGANEKSPPGQYLRPGLLLLLGLSVFLQGCFIDRLIALRSQSCSFNEYFAVTVDSKFMVELHEPVLLEKDLRLIWGAAPTTTSNSAEGSTLSYHFQRSKLEAANDGATLLDEFSVEFDFIPVNGQPHLSKIYSNDLPPELLLTATAISLSGLDELSKHACQVDINPFTRTVALPLDQSWFHELPSRDELVSLLGRPDSTLGEGKGLVYQYSLKGSDDENHTVDFVIWYDESGAKPFALEAGFYRYQMHTDLETALMEVQIEI